MVTKEFLFSLVRVVSVDVNMYFSSIIIPVARITLSLDCTNSKQCFINSKTTSQACTKTNWVLPTYEIPKNQVLFIIIKKKALSNFEVNFNSKEWY